MSSSSKSCFVQATNDEKIRTTIRVIFKVFIMFYIKSLY
ncbi:hypothetical protein [Flavivirga aquatica]